jgi:uncharacterized protein YecE (DUF72 family)
MYDDWRGRFYPKDLPRTRWLAHYAERHPCVELNNSFYRLPTRDRFERWAEQVPDEFVFAVKVSRYLSHIKRLVDPAEPVERFLDRAVGLGRHFGPSLLQLPPNLPRDDERLRAVLRCWPTRRHRLAIEFRHDSWFCAEVRDQLERAGVALCLTDRRSQRPEPAWATADWGYVRLHEGTASPWPSYGRRALRSWAERMRSLWPDGDVWVFFNNDQRGAAIHDADTLTRLVGPRPSRLSSAARRR